MSRGFVKEDDQEEIPLVPPRADLPEGVINYVTAKGKEALLLEREELMAEREHIAQDGDKDKRISFNFITAKLQLLNNRIATAQIIELSHQPKDEVRFGATVALKIGKSSAVQHYQIVGVDEADIAKQKLSFISPIAKLLIGKRVGDKPVLKLAKEDRVFEIISISY
ncbi:GreA/GreB family elongation factor [Sediminibacter sp. Hel_I_10]|uniref:GreA/GreB family elongation factor n=1 Tax=Sediminibacter sp. Hel_I_10 TaxID=1392490 RepID=UPI00047E8B2C|nr:GreA/GreB family elongation factor [Sediminibacter sp. Hel_I_10]